MWQTQAQGQPPAVSQTIGNHSTLNFPLSCHPPWLLTTTRAPSGAANFLLAPPLTCENSRGLWGEWLASTGPYAEPLMSWHQTAERGRTVAARLLHCWPFDGTHSGCCQWGSQREGGQTAEQCRSLSQLENHFFEDLQDTPVGPGSWHLIWGVWSSWGQGRLLPAHCNRRPAVGLLVHSCPRPGRNRLGEISVLNPLNAKRESPRFLQPLLDFH